jgi:hypothetical protein
VRESRFCNAAYAACNLAVMSTRANRDKGACGVDDAMSFGRQIEVERLGQTDGMSVEHWARIAVLTSFVTPMSPSRRRALTRTSHVDNDQRRACAEHAQPQRAAVWREFESRGGHRTRCRT